MKTLTLSDDAAVCDDVISPPPSVRPDGIGALLDVVSERLEPGGLLVLAGAWADYLEPTRGLLVPPDDTVTVTSGRWSARVADPNGDPWVRWTVDAGPQRGRSVWTADMDAMKPHGRSTPLIDDQPILTAMYLHRWQATTGTPWAGTPGMVGNSMFRDGWTRGAAPRWTLDRAAPVPWDEVMGGERAYSPLQWHTDYSGTIRGYDLNRAYFSALLNLEAAGDQLQYAGSELQFTPERGGVWRVDVEPWTDERLPDPAGYGEVLDDGTRWLTTPTLALLQQLADDGAHMGFRVIESWTAPKRRLCREWCAALRPLLDDDAGFLTAAAKRVYQETWGMWARPSGRVYRPDWHLSVLSLARANLWRKMHRAGRDDDRWPVRIETDAVFYPAADDQTWEQAAPASFRLDPEGRKLGAFKDAEVK